MRNFIYIARGRDTKTRFITLVKKPLLTYITDSANNLNSSQKNGISHMQHFLFRVLLLFRVLVESDWFERLCIGLDFCDDGKKLLYIFQFAFVLDVAAATSTTFVVREREGERERERERKRHTLFFVDESSSRFRERERERERK